MVTGHTDADLSQNLCPACLKLHFHDVHKILIAKEKSNNHSTNTKLPSNFTAHDLNLILFLNRKSLRLNRRAKGAPNEKKYQQPTICFALNIFGSLGLLVGIIGLISANADHRMGSASFASHSERSAAKSKNRGFARSRRGGGVRCNRYPANVSGCDSRGSSTTFRKASTPLRMTRVYGLFYIESTVRIFLRSCEKNK